MAYEQRPLRRQKVRYNDANDDTPLTYQLLVDGAKVTPTSATITIYAPGNSTALVDAAAMTKSGSLLTYAPDTTTVASWPVDTGYRAHVITTYSAVTYPDDLYFDVAKFILRFSVGYDQLVSRDEAVAGMTYADDEDLSPIIEATRDELQLLIESKVLGDGKLLESMVLDRAAVEVPGVLLVLSNLYRAKHEYETAAVWREDFARLWRASMASVRYDENEDLEEDSTVGGTNRVAIGY
jgi:hypothetical protein